MRLAIPVDGEEMETNVCISFGRAPYFMIYDTETEARLLIENTAANSQGGAGIKAAQLLVDSKVDALLTPRCGENAAAVILSAKIKIFKTAGTSTADNIRDFVSGSLTLLEEIHAGFHGHGGR
ncbi:MAG: NifB/NifX family molybdenum-iron cluster-binding protein [Saccharofermentanales bacterium]